MGFLADVLNQVPQYKDEVAAGLRKLTGVRANLTFGPLAPGSLVGDPREAYYHWFHLKCMNPARPVRFGRLRTAATEVELFLEVFRHGTGRELEDRAVIIGGVELRSIRHKFLVDDTPVFLPVLVVAPKRLKHPLSEGKWLQPGTYLTGQRFIEFGQVETERLRPGRYTLQISIGPGRRTKGAWAHEFEVAESEPISEQPVETPLLSADDSPLGELRGLIAQASDSLLYADLGPNQTEWTLEKWHDRTEQWKDCIFRALDKCGATQEDKNFVQELGDFKKRKFTGINENHARLKERLAERIKRLQKTETRLTRQQSSEAAEPSEEEWDEMERRFGQIEGDADAIWCHYPATGEVRWSVYPKSDGGGRLRDVQRFEAEAERAGRLVARMASVPGKFPNTEKTDDFDRWLNAVAAEVDRESRMEGSGRDEKGEYTSGHINKIVDASRVACVRLAAKSKR